MAADAGVERVFRYKMYRNPPKPQLAVMPVQSGHLDPEARETFYHILRKESEKIRSVKVVELPSDYRARLYLQESTPPSLQSLARKNINLVLVSRLDFKDGEYSFYAELISTDQGTVQASYQESCSCPIGELVFWILPESMRRLDGGLGTHHGNCGKDMARITPPKAIPNPDSSGEGRKAQLKPFCIDHFEYPNLYGEQPLTNKNFREASALCSSQGKRLCREEEWDMACRGTEKRLYPYGPAYVEGACNTQSNTIHTSGEFSVCRSPHGVYDMSGNVYEWTASNWGAKYPDKVVRGGNWEAGSGNSSCAARFAHLPEASTEAIGFRCCSTLEP